MTEDPSKNNPASKGQGAAGSKKDGPSGVSRQQAPQGAAEAKPAPEKPKVTVAPAAASPPPARDRAEEVGKDSGKEVGKDSGKNVGKESPSGEKGVAPGSPAAVPVTAPPGAPVTAPPGAPVTTPAASSADSAAAGPAPQPGKSSPPEKPASDAAKKPEAPDKPKPDAAKKPEAPDKPKPDAAKKPEVPDKPRAEAAATPGAGPSRPAAEPWKPATEPAAAASAPRPQSTRPESTRPERTPGESPGASRPGGPEGKSPQPPAQSPPKRRQGCLALIAVLVILVVGGIVTWPYWSPTVAPFVQDYLPARPADEQIASLENRIVDLEQTVRQAALRQEDVTALQRDAEAQREQMNALIGRLQDVEPGVTGVVPEGIDERLNALRSEGQQLGQRVTSLDEQVSGLAEQVTGLGEQVSGLDAQVTGGDEQVTRLEEQVRTLSQQLAATRDVTQDAAAVALGLSRLSETIGTSRAYRAELDAFKNVADEAMLDPESLQPLETYAENGVPRFADLYRRFPEMADAVVGAGVETNDDGPLQTTVSRLRSLVTIRRTGEAALEAGGSDAVLEVARNRMEAGDLPGAIDAVEQLAGAPAEAAAWWLDAARSRLAVQRAMERIQIRAIAMLSSKEG